MKKKLMKLLKLEPKAPLPSYSSETTFGVRMKPPDGTRSLFLFERRSGIWRLSLQGGDTEQDSFYGVDFTTAELRALRTLLRGAVPE